MHVVENLSCLGSDAEIALESVKLKSQNGFFGSTAMGGSTPTMISHLTLRRRSPSQLKFQVWRLHRRGHRKGRSNGLFKQVQLRNGRQNCEIVGCLGCKELVMIWGWNNRSVVLGCKLLSEMNRIHSFKKKNQLKSNPWHNEKCSSVRRGLNIKDHEDMQ